MIRTPLLCLALGMVVGICMPTMAATIDGQNIPSEGLTLRATQDSPTGFGNAAGGGQDSAGGSELNQLFADIDGETLTMGITGNLEGNFNKFFIFFDAVPGGENVLASDNVDNGFGEINGLQGFKFAGNATMDHGLRFEIGGGFYGVNAFDLIDNTAFSVVSGGGPGDLPISNVGSGGVTVGWDNSNTLGVDGASADGADTATTGWELEIDMPTLFGATPPNGVGISMVITSGDGSFLSNQTLPGIGGGGNIGGDRSIELPVVAVPEPSTIALAVLGLAALASGGKFRS